MSLTRARYRAPASAQACYILILARDASAAELNQRILHGMDDEGCGYHQGVLRECVNENEVLPRQHRGLDRLVS